MRINNNIMAMNTHRQYGINNTNVSSSVEKLSSGYRINRAGDDAAGLAISEKMRAQIRGLTMASKNSQDAISLVQTAEGALQTTHDILQRMREIAVQSSSDTNESTIDRNALNKEFQALMAEIDDTADKTAFNDQKLIDGTFAGDKYTGTGSPIGVTVDLTNVAGVQEGTVKSIDISVTAGVAHVDETKADTTAVADSAFTAATFELTDGLGDKYNGTALTFSAVNNGGTITITAEIDGVGVSTATVDAGQLMTDDAETTIEFADLGTLTLTSLSTHGFAAANDVATAISATTGGTIAGGVNEVKAVDGTLTVGGKTVESGATSVTLDDGTVVKFGVPVDLSTLTDASYDATAGSGTWSLTASGTAGNPFTVQTGANKGDELKINIDNMDATSLGLKTSAGVAIDVSSQKTASAAIKTVNDAINQVSSQRADLGALQNRLEFKISNLDTSAENLQSAESRIRDLDMAKEMTEFTKNNILSQAATAMLAQANSLPQGVLQLLG